MKYLSNALLTLAILMSLGFAFGLHRTRTSHGATLEELHERIGRLENRVAEAAPPSPAPSTSNELRTLEQRLALLESGGSRSPVEEVPAKSPPAGVPLEEPDPVPTDHAEFEGLLEGMLANSLDPSAGIEGLERFWDLAKNTDIIDARMAELEGLVEGNPSDTEARMQLADYYLAKLFTVPSGPEQGLWGGKAEQQWKQVLELDPEHWDAQFTLANNYSYYPDFLNKTGDAISGLERAREIQQLLPPTEQHTQTYLSLARMYLRKGKSDEAREALEGGLDYHPGNAALLEALEDLQ